MAINQHKQDVVANNLANVNTTGFKRDFAVFKERMPEAFASAGKEQFMPSNLRNATGGLFVSDTQTDWTLGQPEVTNRNLDVSLEGEGFFMVQDGDEINFTRDGRLAVINNQLVREIDGKAILDDRGQPISLPDVAKKDILINNDGTILAKNEEVAKLGVVKFENPQKLRKVGENLISADGQDYEASETPIVSQAIEKSTVDPAKEMVEMIQVSRTFQMNAEMLKLQDDTLSRLINELPQL
jgi:flagellar basal-body rod protein FlgG